MAHSTVRTHRLALCALLLAGCIRQPQNDPRRAAPAAQTPPRDVALAAPDVAAPPTPVLPTNPADRLRFVVRVTGGAAEDARLPLVVALHGLGDTPEAFIELVTSMNLRLRVAAPAGIDRWGDGYAWFGMRTELPQERWVAGIRRAAEVLTPEIQRVASERPTCGLPVLLGFSQGGMLSYATLARPGAGVFAALPIGGLLPRELWPVARDVGGLLPSVSAFHGAADPRVPLSDDRATNDAFRAVGFRAELRVYPGVGHSIPPQIAADVKAKLAEVMRSQGCPVD